MRHFTDKQIADVLSQAKQGTSNRTLCEKYQFSASTLRRWKEQHDDDIRNELKTMESQSATLFLCLTAFSLILAVVFTKAVGALCIPFMFFYCFFYIIRFRKKTAEFVSNENIFLSRSGFGARNAFYCFSWMFVVLFLLVIAYILINGAASIRLY